MADSVVRALRSRGIDIVESSDPHPHEEVDAIVVAGGDGTVVSTLGVAVEARLPLGLMPIGTFNDLARGLGIPVDVEAAAAVIAGGRTRRIDIGKVNDRYFVNESSIGLSTRIARRQTPEVKQRFGVFGVIGTTLQTLGGSRPFVVELEYDGKCERFKTVQLTVANNPRFGGIIDVDTVSMEDGALDLFSVEARNPLRIAPMLQRLLARDLTPVPGLRRRRASRFTVRTVRPHHVSTDGEPAGRTPATFESLRSAIEIFIP